MPQLQTLDGQPLSWADLHALNAAWWAREREREQTEVVWMQRRRWKRKEVREWQVS